MAHIAQSQLRKQSIKGSARHQGITEIRACLSLWGRIRCERHSITALKSMRRRVVAWLRLAARNDGAGGME